MATTTHPSACCSLRSLKVSRMASPEDARPCPSAQPISRATWQTLAPCSAGAFVMVWPVRSSWRPGGSFTNYWRYVCPKNSPTTQIQTTCLFCARPCSLRRASFSSASAAWLPRSCTNRSACRQPSSQLPWWPQSRVAWSLWPRARLAEGPRCEDFCTL